MEDVHICMERLASCAAHVKRVVLVMVLAHEGTGDVREGERAVWAYPPCHACLAARVAVTMAPKVTDMAPNVTDRPATYKGFLPSACALCVGGMSRFVWGADRTKIGASRSVVFTSSRCAVTCVSNAYRTGM